MGCRPDENYWRLIGEPGTVVQGVNENGRLLVRFDPEEEASPLRIWDNVGDDLVERVVTTVPAKSLVLPGHWAVVKDPKLGITLRLSRDEQGRDLYATKAERIRELEAALARHGR